MQERFNNNFNFVLASIKKSVSRLEGDCETARLQEQCPPLLFLYVRSVGSVDGAMKTSSRIHTPPSEVATRITSFSVVKKFRLERRYFF